MTSNIAVWLVLVVVLRATLVAALQRLSEGPFALRHRVYDMPVKPQQRLRERYAPVAGAALDALATGMLVHFGVISFAPASLVEPVVFLATHILLVEPIYYGYHRLLHTPYLYRKHHYRHHLSVVTRPSTSFTFTFAERASYTALFAIPVLAASHLGVLSLPGLAVYLLVFDFTNAIGHFNFEFFGRDYPRKKRRLLLYTPSFHARHHTRFRCNYSLFMPVFDHLFKTNDPDEAAVFERARSGRPLRRIGEDPRQVPTRTHEPS